MLNNGKVVLADKLKELRKSFAMTQDDIAELLSMSRTSFSKYENGATVPPLNVLRKLASIYNVPIEYLIHDDQPGKLIFRSNEDELSDSEDDSIRYFTQLTKEEKMIILKLRLMQNEKKREIINSIEEVED